MKRATRICFNSFAPPAYATALLTFLEIFERPRVSLKELPRFVALILVFAYLFALIPSGLHAWFMEVTYRRWGPPISWLAVRYSSVSGLCAGLIFDFILLDRDALRPSSIEWSALIYPALGLVVGFLVGLSVKNLSRASTNLRPTGSKT